MEGETKRQLPSYIPELDGMRAIAVGMVLLLHVLCPDPESIRTLALIGIPRPVMVLLEHGWLGVDLFFILSGFLITGILLETKDSPRYFRNFYGRRILRILPLYLACIAVMSFFYAGHAAYFLLSVFFLANAAWLFDIPIPHGPTVFWSLAVEEHFYLIWPWFVRIMSRRALAMVCGLVVLGEPLLRAIFTLRGTEVYPLSWFRFDGLASGALLALWFRCPMESTRKSIILAAGCIAADVVLTIAGLPYGINAMTVAGKSLRYTQANLIFCSAMLTAIAARSTLLTAPLRSRFASLTGNLSYCLYLVHLSVFDAYMAFFRRWKPEGLTFADVVLRAAVVLSISYTIALLSRRFLERPFLSLKRFFRDEPAGGTRPKIGDASTQDKQGVAPANLNPALSPTSN